MAQSGIAGATDYSMQSDKDILDDVQRWIEISYKMKTLLSECSIKMNNSELWKIAPYNFRMAIDASKKFWETAINDLSAVKVAIDNNSITSKDVKLLRKIGENAEKLYKELGITYHENMNTWHDYENRDFLLISKMYSDNRDYCATLIDADNAGSRLEDYEVEKSLNISNCFNSNVHSFNNTSSNVNNGINGDFNCGDVSGTYIQIGDNNSCYQDNSVNQDIPYDSIIDALRDINNNISSRCGEFGEIKTLCDEALAEAEKRNDPRSLKEKLERIRNLAKNVGGFVIENTVKGILSYFESIV